MEWKRFEQGDPRGLPDREAVVVEFSGLRGQRIEKKFSSNWDPRSFSLVRGRHGELILSYVVGHERAEERAIIVDRPAK